MEEEEEEPGRDLRSGVKDGFFEGEVVVAEEDEEEGLLLLALARLVLPVRCCWVGPRGRLSNADGGV